MCVKSYTRFRVEKDPVVMCFNSSWELSECVTVGMHASGSSVYVSGSSVYVSVRCKCVDSHLSSAAAGLLTIRPLWSSVPADTPPPAYMPPDEQMGQEGSMETSSSGPRNMPSGGEESDFTLYLTGMIFIFLITGIPAFRQNSCFQKRGTSCSESHSCDFY